MTTPEVKGTTSASFVGIIFIISAVAMSLVSISAIEKFSMWHLLLLSIFALVAMIGLGLLKFNYHAWLAATVFTAIKVVVGLSSITASFSHGNPEAGSQIAIQMGWPIVILYLLYRSRGACTRKIDGLPSAAVVKRNLPALLAGAGSCLALLIASFYGNGGMLLFFGLPLLALGSGVFYLIGLKIQKRCGWN